MSKIQVLREMWQFMRSNKKYWLAPIVVVLLLVGILMSRQDSPAFRLDAITDGDQYAVNVTVPPLWLNPGLYSADFKVLLWGTRDDARHVSDKIPIDITGLPLYQRCDGSPAHARGAQGTGGGRRLAGKRGKQRTEMRAA